MIKIKEKDIEFYMDGNPCIRYFVPEELKNGDFLSIFYELRYLMEYKGFSAPFIFRSNPWLQKRASQGVHFYPSIGITERIRIDQDSAVLKWDFDNSLEKNELIIEIPSEDMLSLWKKQEIDKIKEQIRDLERKIEKIKDLNKDNWWTR